MIYLQSRKFASPLKKPVYSNAYTYLLTTVDSYDFSVGLIFVGFVGTSHPRMNIPNELID